MSAFDPHVGENLCQIRACQTIDIFESRDASLIFNQKTQDCLENFTYARIRITALIDQIDKHLRKPKKYHPYDYHHIALFHYLEPFGICITNHIYYLTISFILSKYKIIGSKGLNTINYKKLIIDSFTSKNITRRLVHKYQLYLSLKSVNYIVDLEDDLIKKKLLQLLILKDDDDRDVIPCFIAMIYILKRLKELNIPISIVFRDKTNHMQSLIFKPNLNCYQCVPDSLSAIEDNSFYTIYCNNLNASFLMRGDIEQAFLQSMATHPQYSGLKLTALKHNPFIHLMTCIDNKIASQAKQLAKLHCAYKGIEHGYDQDILSIKHIVATSCLNYSNKNQSDNREFAPQGACKSLTAA